MFEGELDGVTAEGYQLCGVELACQGITGNDRGSRPDTLEQEVAK